MSKVPILLRLSDVPKASSGGKGKSKNAVPRSPLEDTITEAHDNNYYGVCVDITNDLWKKRWSSLCLTTPEGDDSATAKRSVEEIQNKQRVAELWRVSDAFHKDEVNITKLGKPLICSYWNPRY